MNLNRRRYAGLGTLVLFLSIIVLPFGRSVGSASGEPSTWLLKIDTSDERTIARLAAEGARPVREGPSYTLVLANAEEEELPLLKSLHPVRLAPWNEGSRYFLVDLSKVQPDTPVLKTLAHVLYADAVSAVAEVAADDSDGLTGAYPTAQISGRTLRYDLGLARGEEAARSMRTVTYSYEIQAMVDSVDSVWLQAKVQDLQNFGTRKSNTTGGTNAQNYLVGQFTGLGYTDVSTYAYRSGYCADVICKKIGSVTPNQIYVIGGHYDSTSNTGSAPGADDNGSGTAGVLAAAKIMFHHQFESTVYFVCWSGEEQGMLGSAAWCAWAASQGLDIRANINLDMEGYLASTKNMDLISNTASSWLRDLVNEVVPLYVPTLPVVAGSLPMGASSDHASFWDQGYSAVFFFEDSHNYSPYIHTANDVIGTSLNNFAFMKENTQAAIATLTTMAGYVPDPASGVGSPGLASADSPRLFPIRPNPVTAGGELCFELPAAGSASLSLYDAAGHLVRVLVQDAFTRGRHSYAFDGSGAAGRILANGTYFLRLSAGGQTREQRITVLK